MKHSFEELYYHVNPDTERRSFFTPEATKGKFAGMQFYRGVSCIDAGPTKDGSFTLNEPGGNSSIKWAEGSKRVWWAWYDTKEERDDAVMNKRIYQLEASRRKTLLGKIDANFTTDQLEQLCKNLGLIG